MKTTNMTKKIIFTVASLIICLTTMFVAVYAAVQQSLKISNTITITTDGQAKAAVSVFKHSQTGNTAITEMPEEEFDWREDAIITKSENEDSAEETDAESMIFSQTTGKNLYAYKLEIENKSSVPVNINITSSTESNEEIDVYCGESFDQLTAIENGSGVNYEKSGVAVSSTIYYYIVVCANIDLANMTAATAEPFDIDIVISI